MADAPSMSNRRRSTYWLLIALLAVAIHLVLLLSIKPGFFEVFRKTLSDQSGASSPGPSFPQAIVVVPLEVESDEAEAPVEEPREEHPPPSQNPVNGRGDSDLETINILDVVGQAQAPLPSQPGSSTAIVPPRPVEITWPETEKLGHCLGQHIDIRIRVGTEGEILLVEPTTHDHPADCTQAAIDAAQRIRFQPGTVDGKPKAMWAQIRIEFRKQRR
jgi:hypothetical protein